MRKVNYPYRFLLFGLSLFFSTLTCIKKSNFSATTYKGHVFYINSLAPDIFFRAFSARHTWNSRPFSLWGLKALCYQQHSKHKAWHILEFHLGQQVISATGRGMFGNPTLGRRPFLPTSRLRGPFAWSHPHWGLLTVLQRQLNLCVWGGCACVCLVVL